MRVHILLLVEKETRPLPADAIALPCEECGREGLCRQSSLQIAKDRSRQDGARLRTLCRPCAAPVARAALKSGPVDCIARPHEMPAMVDWVDEQRLAALRDN